jgi:hypothetical protein
MRKLTVILIVATILIAVVPVLAQVETGESPAALLPADVPLYIEIDISEDGIAAVQEMTSLLFEVSGAAQYSPRPDYVADLNDGLSYTFGSDFTLQAYVLPWAGDAMGLAIYPTMNEYGGIEAEDIGIVIPVAGSDGLAEFEDRLANAADAADVQDDMRVYTIYEGGFVLTEQALYVGTQTALENIFESLDEGVLADDPAFTTVTAALPPDATIWGYMSSDLPAMVLDQADDPDMMGGISLSTLVEAIFAIHPGISAAEEGLLAAQGLNGLGFAVQVSDNTVDVIGVISVDATYSQPTFTSAFAGDALLQYVPGTAVAVLDSYDIVVAAAPIVGLALMGPVIGNVFDEIVYSLETGVTPTPLPTPTPPPALTADDIVAEAQPYINQIELFMGMSLEELYTLTNGEYAIALVPTGVEGIVGEYGYINYPSSPMGFAGYLQTPDSAALLATIEDVTSGVLPNLMGMQVDSGRETINGIDVSFLGPEDSTRLAYGALNDTTVFVATEDIIDQVLATANGEQTALVDTRLFPAETIASYGETALMYYMDIGKYSALNAYSTDAFVPAVAVTGGLVIGADGLFTGRVTLTFGK